MKKIGCLLLVLCLGLVGCSSKEDRTLSNAIKRNDYDFALEYYTQLQDSNKIEESTFEDFKVMLKNRLDSIIEEYVSEAENYDEDKIYDYYNEIKDIVNTDLNVAYLSDVKFMKGKYAYVIKKDIETAKKLFDELDAIDYKANDIESYTKEIEILNTLKGTWKSDDKEHPMPMVVDGENLTHISKISDYDIVTFDRTIDISNGLIVEKMMGATMNTYEIIDDKTLRTNDTHIIYKKISDSTDIPKQKEVIVPKIGMTAEEVNGSIWGKPDKINKTTTKYGVSEQWCYSDNRYVYLDDGIVTAIQE